MNLLPLQHIKGFGTLGKCPLKFPEDPSAMHSEFSEEQGDTLDPWHNLVSGMPPFCAQAPQRIKGERGFSPEHKSGLRPGISFWLSAGVMIVSLASSPPQPVTFHLTFWLCSRRLCTARARDPLKGHPRMAVSGGVLLTAWVLNRDL